MNVTNKEISIYCENISKIFRLSLEKQSSLKERILFFNKRKFEEFWALSNISFTVRKGETLGIIGANGSGKSTLLKILADTLTPTEGHIKTHGRIAALLELGAGFQPNLTGRENVYLNGALLGFKKREIDDLFDTIVRFSELDKFIDTAVKNYSSGMYIRLGFAVAVHLDPDILLIDEVLAVGDELFQKKCLNKIQSFKDRNITIVYVSHDLDTVARICDRVIFLNQGKIMAEGKATEVIGAYHKSMLPEEFMEEYGNRQIEITNVEITNSHGKKKENFLTGEEMIVTIEYDAKIPIKDPVFGISIHDKHNILCFGTNTKINNVNTGTLKGIGQIKAKLAPIELASGIYDLSVSVHSLDHITQYHRIERRYNFVIENKSETTGLIAIPTKWDLS